MDAQRIRRHFPKLLLLIVFGLAIVGLVMLSEFSGDSEQFARLYRIILSINLLAAAVLMALIGANLVRLYRDYHARVPGARIESRLVSAFVVLVIAPLAVVYLYSAQFINEGIDSWFDVDVEQGLNDALDLSRSALNIQMRENMSRTRAMADVLYGLPDTDIYAYVPRLRADANAQELSVFAGASRIIATSSTNPAGQLPALPSEELLLSLRRSGSYVSLEPGSDDSYVVQTALLLPGGFGRSARVLKVLYPLDAGLGPLAGSVQNTVTRYAELSFLRDPLKGGFFLTLSLVVLVTMLIAVYSAFFFARRLSAPVQSLIAGTRSVARGDFDTRLPSGGSDEIGLLVDSFNDMIEQLDAARSDARRNEAQVENERASLEVVLARLSTGVIALEQNLTLRTANRAAEQLLGQDLRVREGLALQSLAAGNPALQQIVDILLERLEARQTEWREQIVLNTGSGGRVFVCACTALPGSYRSRSGLVLVFDDITELLQAQRDAAWGEVARRLAHEIKNPLTPIQLSAERLRRKLLDAVDPASVEILDRATQTIIQQVVAMRDMVNAFSEYARAPAMNRTLVDLNQLISQVADLYPAQKSLPVIRLDLDPQLPDMSLDAVRIRQVLHNLIRNALEALEQQPGAELVISTALLRDKKGLRAEIAVTDNGPGLSAADQEHIFEPYVTTKTKGTGLGLAIVKKLVEEHGGSVMLSSEVGQGTRVRILLPLASGSEDAARIADNKTMRRQSA